MGGAFIDTVIFEFLTLFTMSAVFVTFSHKSAHELGGFFLKISDAWWSLKAPAKLHAKMIELLYLCNHNDNLRLQKNKCNELMNVIVKFQVSAHLLSVYSDYLKPNHSMGVDQKSFAAFEQWWAEMWYTQLRQQSKAHMTVFTRMCLQGLNRVGKDSQVGHGGVQRKDWHDYEAIKRDSSRSGKSRTPHRCSVKHRWHIQHVHSYAHKGFTYIPSNCNSPIPSLGLIALQLCSNHVNLCFECSSSVIHAVCICYSNHQLGFIFFWGKSASIQTVYIIRNGFVPEMSRLRLRVIFHSC